MQKFYFTYAKEGHPFTGGWTVVIAPCFRAAIRTFRKIHPDKTKGVLHCADVYSEFEFRETPLATLGNYGHKCHETIYFR